MLRDHPISLECLVFGMLYVFGRWLMNWGELSIFWKSADGLDGELLIRYMRNFASYWYYTFCRWVIDPEELSIFWKP